MNNWLIVGATSGVAKPLARMLAEKEKNLFLAARNVDQLEVLAADVRTRSGVNVETGHYDALETRDVDVFLDDVEKRTGALEGIVWAVGSLEPEQRETEMNPEATRRAINVNFTAGALLLNAVALRMEQQKRGKIVVIGSVAGDRGRAKNYSYGAAKAGLHAFAQGLRQRLSKHKVQVLTIKPGFIDTKMYRSTGQSSGPLVASPDKVAKDIMNGIELGRDVLYTPWFWRFILLIVRHIPAKIFKRMNM